MSTTDSHHRQRPGWLGRRYHLVKIIDTGKCEYVRTYKCRSRCLCLLFPDRQIMRFSMPCMWHQQEHCSDRTRAWTVSFVRVQCPRPRHLLSSSTHGHLPQILTCPTPTPTPPHVLCRRNRTHLHSHHAHLNVQLYIRTAALLASCAIIRCPAHIPTHLALSPRRSIHGRSKYAHAFLYFVMSRVSRRCPATSNLDPLR